MCYTVGRGSRHVYTLYEAATTSKNQKELSLQWVLDERAFLAFSIQSSSCLREYTEQFNLRLISCKTRTRVQKARALSVLECKAAMLCLIWLIKLRKT